LASAKSRAKLALDAVPNSGHCGWAALEAKLACQITEGKLEMKKGSAESAPPRSRVTMGTPNL